MVREKFESYGQFFDSRAEAEDYDYKIRNDIVPTYLDKNCNIIYLNSNNDAIILQNGLDSNTDEDFDAERIIVHYTNPGYYCHFDSIIIHYDDTKCRQIFEGGFYNIADMRVMTQSIRDQMNGYNSQIHQSQKNKKD